MPLAMPRCKRAAAWLAICLSATVLQPLPGWAWGPDGHVWVNRAAAQHIPSTMPAFLRRAEQQLGYLGPEPDRWREKSEYAVKQAGEPDHFIDLEKIAPLGELPPGRYEYYRLLYERRAKISGNADEMLPERVGLQPYMAMEIHDRLRASFREYRKLRGARRPTLNVEQVIIFYAGWLGHYVGDGSQPLHTTIHYNGWVGASNPRGYTAEPGIHGRFETAFVSQNLSLRDFTGLVRPPSKLENPFQDYVGYLKRSFELFEKVYQLDKNRGFQGAGSAEAREFTRQRLAAGSQMLLDLWYTAWLESAENE